MTIKKTNIIDVAQAAGVSIATVSRAMKSGSYGIKQQTRDYIKKIAEELDYSPNRSAQSLASGRSNVIGIIVPDLHNPFHTELIEEIDKQIHDIGCESWILMGHNNSARVENHIQAMLDHRARGIILLPTDHGDQPPVVYRELLNYKNPPMPVILVANKYLTHNRYVIDGDNIVGAKLAVNHLIKLGHSRIALITGNMNNVSLRDRFEGYKKAFQENHVELDDSLIIYKNFFLKDRDNTYKRIKLLFESPEKPTAIFVCSDYIALAVMRYLRKLGLQIPDDVSIVGFDNIKLSNHLHENLTTVEFPIEAMAKEAVNILIAWKENGGAISNRIINIEPRLIVRESTKKL